MMQEIGSEFYLTGVSQKISRQITNQNVCWTYSGRTAIYTALTEILSRKCIDTAWLPSYCCASMIKPFVDLGLSTKFYRVSYLNGKIRREWPTPKKNDVVLTMSYFGLHEECENQNIIRYCREEKITVIEDRTHSLLNTDPLQQRANYSVASIRKWGPLASGGMAWTESGKISQRMRKPDRALIDLCIRAMKEKQAYLQSDKKNADLKKQFLSEFKQCNQGFSADYQEIGIDDWSAEQIQLFDWDQIRRARRSNAKVLLNGIMQISGIQPVFLEVDNDACPLFVPVVLPRRDELQQWLARYGIYCPAHWPCPSSNAFSNMYRDELSLVCDQRYGTSEMEQILNIMNDFQKRFL